MKDVGFVWKVGWLCWSEEGFDGRRVYGGDGVVFWTEANVERCMRW